MLSILIPVYRYDVGPLVRALKEQLDPQSFAWEIRLYDDASPAEERLTNAELVRLDPDRIVYREMEENLGRARIRNRMAEDAVYPTLLFLDADGDIGPDFISEYRPWLERGAVVCGGRTYDDRAIPPDRMLHWYYGSSRESQPAKQRSRRPYAGFQTNNFLVPRSLMREHPFDEAFRGYGHEDTLWGRQLEAMDVAVIHVDNPVAHRGLEDHRNFLDKQRAAVQNLKKLSSDHPELETRLSRFARRMRWLKPVAVPLIGALRPYLENELTRELPGSLYYLDALKLYWYWEEER